MASTTGVENRFSGGARLHSYQLRLAAAANPDPPQGRHAEEVLSRSGRARGGVSRTGGPNVGPCATACGFRVGRGWGGRMRWMRRQGRRCASSKSWERGRGADGRASGLDVPSYS